MKCEKSYKELIELSEPWLDYVLDEIKKDLKNEHLKIDPKFCRRYFLGKSFLQVNVEELKSAYLQEVREGNLGLGEFIATRWLLKHTDCYYFFEKSLSAIDPNFEKITELTSDQARPLVEGSIKQFGPVVTYLFTLFNFVALPEEISNQLRKLAQERHEEVSKQQELEEGISTLESLKKRHSREVLALKDNFEKKFNGLKKKYLQDVEALKTEISQLKASKN